MVRGAYPAGRALLARVAEALAPAKRLMSVKRLHRYVADFAEAATVCASPTRWNKSAVSSVAWSANGFLHKAPGAGNEQGKVNLSL